MNQYPSYKDSGVERIGDIPSGWLPKRNKFLFAITKNIVGKKSNNYQLLSLTKKGIILRDIDSGKGKFPEKFDTYQIVEKNDLVFCLFDIDETPRTVGLSPYYGMITGAYKVIKCIEGVIPTFLYYNYLSIDDVKGLRPFYTGLRKVVRTETFLDINVQIPPLQEQKQISAYLDHKTQQIDTLIDKTQQKIELLKEQRTALINQVVTKGLDPNVEVKDSGVEWIGDIPKGWDVYPMKYGLLMINQKEQPETDSIKISPENVESDTGVCLNLYSDYSGEGMKFVKGDILFNKLRVYLKKIIFTEYDGYSMGEMIVLRTKNNLFNRYIYYILFNQGVIDLLNSQSTGVKLPRVSPEVILNTEIVYPSIDEQQQIVNHLDKETSKIDTLIEKENQRTELLKEYRQSLISEVVTGKVDVREEVLV